MRHIVRVAVLLALGAQSAFAASPLTGKWRIVAVVDAPALDAARASAEFAGNGRFASSVGCNRIAGMPTVSGDRLSFGRMMTTRMACPPPVDQVEQSYLAALQSVRGYRLDGRTLLLLGEDGQTLVTLARA